MSDTARPITTDLLCPRCRAELQVSNNKLPEACPGCKLLLRAPRQKAFNHNFLLAWRKSFCWYGRAPRREFWGFVVIMGGIGLLPALVLDVLSNGLLICLVREYLYPIPEIPGLVRAVLGSMAGAALLLWLLLLPIPLFSVTVRRLHDVGRSLLLPLLTLLLGIPGVILPAILLFFILSSAGQSDCVTNTEVVLAFIPGVLAIIFSLIILMLCLMDSERGTNKYGPSVKYPLE